VGAIRLFLALSVALAHLANETFPDVPRAQWPWFGLGGNWTVMMFFTVSGFLLSFVLDEKYAGPGGISAENSDDTIVKHSCVRQCQHSRT
jgi:peptidoglycan/LPS O-acetylase OafA/YrhL